MNNHFFTNRRVEFFLMFTLILTIIGLYYVDLGIKEFYHDIDDIKFPTGRLKLYLFLLKPATYLPPFLLIITIIGIQLLLSKNRDKVIVVQTSDTIIKTDIDRNILNRNSVIVIDTLLQSSGQMMQVDLTKKTGLKGYQITRILNRFEGLGWIARKRYGMTNLIYLKLIPENNYIQ